MEGKGGRIKSTDQEIDNKKETTGLYHPTAILSQTKKEHTSSH